MLVVLTPLLIDLFSEWSVNTAEQTCNGTINQSVDHCTTLCQERECVLKREEPLVYACV